MKQFSCSKSGFTLVEMLITVLILAFVIIAIYSIFSKVTRTTDVGAWKSSVQQKLRVSMKNLFQDLSNATYPTWIYPNKTEIDDSDEYKLKYRDGELDPWKLGKGEELLTFYICRPGKKKFPSGRNHGRNIVKVTLVMDKYDDGRPKIMYEREVIEDDGISEGKTGVEGMKNFSKVLFEDINFIKFTSEKFVDESSADPSNREKIRFSVEVRASHPKYPKNTLVLKQNIILSVETRKM